MKIYVKASSMNSVTRAGSQKLKFAGIYPKIYFK